MTDQLETTQGQIGELLAAEKHLHELITARLEAEQVLQHPEAGPILETLRQTLDRHINRLEHRLREVGGTMADAGLKGAVSSLGGKLEALFERFRSDTLPRMLRDDYSALALITISYTMLHAAALTLRDQATADLALEHLNDLTPIVVELRKAVPFVVVNELADTYDGADRTAAPLAASRANDAWAHLPATS